MRIVVEGPDGLGKTMIAKDLAHRLILDYEHCGIPTGEAELLELLKRDNVVLDRSWLGELVYPQFAGRHAVISASAINDAQRRNAFKTLYVLLAAPEPPGYKEVEPVYIHNYDAILRAFFDALYIMAAPNTYKVVFNPMHFSSPQLMCDTIYRFVYDFMNGVNPYPRQCEDYHYTYFDNEHTAVDGTQTFRNTCSCGNFAYYKTTPIYAKTHALVHDYGRFNDYKAWFIGEAPGVNGAGKFGIPFYGDASGSYFRYALLLHGWAETDIRIGNAVKCTPPMNQLDAATAAACFTINTARDVIGNAGIVAVGNVSSRLLSAIHVVHKKLYHPAFFMRMGRSSAEYAKYLGDEVWIN